eukprot:Lankesteria_metandrocarpae@DN3541_c1_g1_i1.p2
MAPSWWKSITGGSTNSTLPSSKHPTTETAIDVAGATQTSHVVLEGITTAHQCSKNAKAPVDASYGSDVNPSFPVGDGNDVFNSDAQTPDTLTPSPCDAESVTTVNSALSADRSGDNILTDKRTQENIAALAKLRSLHGPLLKSYARRTLDDEWWIRFLRARDLSIDESVKMIHEDIHWRLTNDVDSILNTSLTYAPFVRQYYPHGYHGVDRQGRPIYIDCIGRADATTILKGVSLDEMMNVYIQEYEQLVDIIFPCCTEAAGHKVNRTTTIVDLQGLGWSHVNNSTRAILKRLSYVSQNHYPEILGQMFIVNAPPIFSGVWTFIRRLIDETTVTKINISSTRSVSWKTRLAEYVDPDQLPDFLGGNVTWQNHEWTTSCFGPWTDPATRAAALPPGTTALTFPPKDEAATTATAATAATITAATATTASSSGMGADDDGEWSRDFASAVALDVGDGEMMSPASPTTLQSVAVAERTDHA